MMNSRSLGLWLTCILFALPFFASAASPDTFTQRFKNVGFHAGSLTEFVGAIQTDENGGTEKFAMNPFLGFSTDVMITPEWAWIPEINWVLPREAGDGITKNLIMLRTDAAWRGSDWWRLRIGTSLMVNNIKGQGGKKKMNNGSGTADFYVPSESRTSVNNTLDLGAEAILDDFGFRFQTFIYSLLHSDRRQYSYTLTLSYYYDMGN